MKADNKLAPRSVEIGNSTLIKKSYIYQIHDLYNMLPRSLTLITNMSIFKKWITKYYLFNITKPINPNTKDCIEQESYLPITICQSYQVSIEVNNPDR